MSAEIVMHDRHFEDLIAADAAVRKVHSGMLWVEGPVYFPLGDYFLWSDIPNNVIYQWYDGSGVRIWRHSADNANGHTRDRQGRLVTCEHLTRRVTRTGHDGSVAVLADTHDGKRLNSPNDVVVKSDDTIWFTDPPYGILSDYEGKTAPQEQNGCYVFRLDPDTGRLDVVANDFVKPNGLAFSPDETVLYISDTGQSHDPDGPHHIRAFDVEDGRRLENGRIFVTIDDGVSDGFRLDIHGNVWTSTAIGVQCYNPAGRLLGEIRLPEVVSNLTFGGPDNRSLLITATTSVYSVTALVSGAR